MVVVLEKDRNESDRAARNEIKTDGRIGKSIAAAFGVCGGGGERACV